METIKQKIYNISTKNLDALPSLLKADFKIAWKKTILDDKNALISMLPNSIYQDSKIGNHNKNREYAHTLGAAALFIWTAANLYDDLSDTENTEKKCLPLANICLMTAFQFAFSKKTLNKNAIFTWNKLLLISESANYQALAKPLFIPPKDIDAANKSLFIMAPSLLILKQMKWPQLEQNKFLMASKYFLAAKQLADDVYDFKEDWRNKRRNFAHKNLKHLPKNHEMDKYYQTQAKRILKLCQLCRRKIKTVYLFKEKNCFNLHLNILEKNCQKAFTK